MNKISELHITILSGEASGDLYGGLLAQSIMQFYPTAHITGIGGDVMSKAGVIIMHPISELSIMGISEVMLHIPKLLFLRKRIVDHIFSSGASTVILIDFPDFNLSVAKQVFQRKKGLGLMFPKIYYFVPPQVWIWRKNRINSIKKLCDGVFPLFSFEHDLYTKQGIKSFYAGHPVNDIILRDQYCQKQNENQVSNITVGLFPGSRMQEITKILPVMLKATDEFDKTSNFEKKPLSVLISRCDWIPENRYRNIIDRSGLSDRISISLTNDSHKIMALSDIILSKSGTVNLEIALFKKPFMVVYKTSWFTWLIAKLLLRIRFISLINILSNKEIVKEFVQHKTKPAMISNEMNRILADSAYTENMIKGLTYFAGEHISPRSHSVTDEIARYLLNEIK